MRLFMGTKKKVLQWGVLSLMGVGIVVGGSGAYGKGLLGHNHEIDLPIKRTVAHYDVPVVTLLDQERRKIHLDQALADPNPVLVEFFFTTCTTFCDIRSARLASVQEELGEANIPISFFSISVDPEFDTPERLLAYSTRMQPVPDNWALLTGPISDIHQVESSFKARNYSSDKMLHQPLTFIRARPGQDWIRLEGMMSSHDLAQQIQIAVLSNETQ
ncbi:MAG: SCO family protein [Nitrospirota bacterium]|nr:SCO family protein [Nitrospirota bacterium]